MQHPVFHSGELNIAFAIPLIGQHFVTSGKGVKASLGSSGGKLAPVVFHFLCFLETTVVVNAWFLSHF